MTLACEDANSKLVDVVTVADDGSQGVDLTVARPTFFVSWRLIRRKFVLQRFILTTVH